MTRTRSLVERVVDGEKWVERLQAEDKAGYWDPISYDERRRLSACEIADMRAEREMRKLEIVVLGKGDT